MNILNQLKSHSSLSHNEKILRDYILEHPHDVLNMDAKQLSSSCFVSTSTIYRLCEKLNISGYADLKVKIAGSMKEYVESTENFNYDFPVKQYQTHHEILNKIKEDYEQTLISTYNFFDLDQLRIVTKALKEAKQIDIYTSAGNIYFAQNFMFQMSEIGVKVNVPVEEYHQKLTAAQSNKDHLAIVISFEGRGLLNDIILKILKENHTPVLLISSYRYQKKKDCIDYHLYICPYENHYNKISSFSTRFSILYILDVLYTCYFETDYENNLNKKLNYYQSMNK